MELLRAQLSSQRAAPGLLCLGINRGGRKSREVWMSPSCAVQPNMAEGSRAFALLGSCSACLGFQQAETPHPLSPAFIWHQSVGARRPSPDWSDGS